MTTLEQLLDLLCKNAQFHISITDVSGITAVDPFVLPSKYLVHAKNFCNLAKHSPAGFRQCMKCKSMCNRLAVQKKQPFCGRCSFGMEEFVYPIVIQKVCVCILYIGNFTTDTARSLQKLQETCRRLNIPSHGLECELVQRTPMASTDFCGVIAEILFCYISRYYEESIKMRPEYHWAVKNTMDYVHHHYASPITLKMIAKTYFINEQYLGRLFFAQTGQTFHQYLVSQRLSHASFLLQHTKKTLTQISEETGFCTPSHFHHAFVKQYRKTPKEYRMQEQG